MIIKTVSILAILFFGQSAYAQAFKGSISFTSNEKEIHRRSIDLINRTASDCLKDDLQKHQSFFRQHGFSPFYGDRSSFAKLTKAEKQSHLRRLGKNPNYVEIMQPTSCVGLALKCLERGFQAAGQGQYWSKIARYTRLNNQYGNALQHALQSIGWKILYWNPAPQNNEAWDNYEKRKDPTNKEWFWGWHSYRYLTVNRQSMYYFNKVDDARTLVGFGTQVPRQFKAIPFYIGTAHTGYHVFPGMYGQVIEGHSTRPITDYYTIESSEFNPLKTGAGPRGQYMSGLIAIPPQR